MKLYFKNLFNLGIRMNITGTMSEKAADVAAKRFVVCVGTAILILALTPALYIIARYW